MANTAFTHDPTITVPSPTVNNRVVTWNGTTGKVFDNVATVTINAGVVAGVTALTVDNLTIDGNTIISTDTNGSITLTPAGSGSVVISKVDINSGDITGVTISGGLTWSANQDLNNVNLTNVDIDSGAIDGTAIGAASASTAVVTSITAPTAVLTNSTNSNAITLNTGATAANYTITMPTAAPATGKVLKTTSGSTSQLEWGDAGSNAFTNDVTVTSGNFVIGTAGKGIDFSITTDYGISTPSELLDDYEEGTFTPLIDQGWPHTSNGMAHSTQFGHYTKIGNRVHINLRVITTGFGDCGTGSAGMAIRGLPFVCDSTGNSETGIMLAYSSSMSTTLAHTITGVTDANGNAKFYIRQSQPDGSGISAGVTRDELTATCTMNFSGMYEVD